jgi:hypothetical protein
MIVVFGSTLYGKVESVPGVCHVATRFLHFFFVPLFPTGSWLVIHKRERVEGAADALKLPAMHWGSVGMGWLRFFLLVAMVVLAIVASTKIGLERPWSQTLPVIAGGLLCAVVFVGSYRFMPARRQSLEGWRGVSGIPDQLLTRASERLGSSSSQA